MTSVGVYITEIPSLGYAFPHIFISDVQVFNANCSIAILCNRLQSVGILLEFSKIRQIISPTVSGIIFL